MAASANSGPMIIWGRLTQMLAAIYGSGGNPDPNSDAGPSAAYQGWAFPDVRILYNKDQVTGYPGSVPSALMLPYVKSAAIIPAALSASNIAAAQTVTNGTAMTLASPSTGIVTNIPVRPFKNAWNGGSPVTVGIGIDFGFAFGSTTAGSATIEVANSASFLPLGMPLVIANVGNAAGTAALLTNVASIVDATHITVLSSAVPLATNAAAPIGTGDLWGPSENGFPLPQAALPFLAAGPVTILDDRQATMRGIRIVGGAGTAGGNFLVSGYDCYGQPLTQLVTVAAASTGYTTKTMKYVTSVVPAFTDAGGTYTVGTADLFGFAYRTGAWENTRLSWAGSAIVTNVGWVGAVTTTPATALTGDVRGTVQTGATGPGTPVTGGSDSNGSIVSLAMSGRRLDIGQFIAQSNLIRGTPDTPEYIFGVTQV